mmetsp:Transcript_18897/g.46871  ORF Transcript_18897/g.46871 Transcript_18897/m.46871 type:complete len:276 (-) Transcript_18897:39-866(-)
MTPARCIITTPSNRNSTAPTATAVSRMAAISGSASSDQTPLGSAALALGLGAEWVDATSLVPIAPFLPSPTPVSAPASVSTSPSSTVLAPTPMLAVLPPPSSAPTCAPPRAPSGSPSPPPPWSAASLSEGMYNHGIATRYTTQAATTHPEHATTRNMASTPPSCPWSAAITRGATVPMVQWLAERHPKAVGARTGVHVTLSAARPPTSLAVISTPCVTRSANSAQVMRLTPVSVYPCMTSGWSSAPNATTYGNPNTSHARPAAGIPSSAPSSAII